MWLMGGHELPSYHDHTTTTSTGPCLGTSCLGSGEETWEEDYHYPATQGQPLKRHKSGDEVTETITAVMNDPVVVQLIEFQIVNCVRLCAAGPQPGHYNTTLASCIARMEE